MLKEVQLKEAFQNAPYKEYFKTEFLNKELQFKLYSKHGEEFIFSRYSYDEYSTAEIFENLANTILNEICYFQEYLDVMIDEERFENIDIAMQDLDDISKVAEELVKYFEGVAEYMKETEEEMER